MRPPLSDVLRSLGACSKSLAWADGYGSAWSTALTACPERSWLTWLYGRLLSRGLVPREPLVLAACLCAREVLHLVPAGEERPLRAIETAEAWCRGEATLDEVRAARRDAWDATYDAAAYADAAAATATATYAAAAAAAAAGSARVLTLLRRELGPHLLTGLATYAGTPATTGEVSL